jgi:endo-1,4-beta-xylanase
MDRRTFLSAAGALACGAAASACTPAAPPTSASAQATPAPATATPEPKGLRALADKRGFRWGSAVAYRLFDVPELRKKQLEIFAKDFNMAALHSGFYWTAIEPERGKINQPVLDSVKQQADALLKLGITDLRGHPLIFPQFDAPWALKGMKDGTIGKSEALDLLTKHIRDTMTPFKGLIREWVVVNEPYREYGKDEGDMWMRTIGEEYVDHAFAVARDTDPQAKLMLNDYENHALPEFDKSLLLGGESAARNKKIIERLKSKNLVDSLGLQMHITMEHAPKPKTVVDTMRWYGVPVHVTELDVNIASLDVKGKDRFDYQARVYGYLLKAALDSGVCESVCLWEFGDKYSWLEDPYFSFSSPNSDCTPWDDDLNPKPAYESIRKALA